MIPHRFRNENSEWTAMSEDADDIDVSDHSVDYFAAKRLEDDRLVLHLNNNHAGAVLNSSLVGLQNTNDR